MTSIRKRLQKEKLDFQESLDLYRDGNKDFVDDEIMEERKYESLYEWDLEYDDYLDDDYYEDPYYEEDYDDLYDWLDDDLYDYYDDYCPQYKPGNHVEEKETGFVYVVTEDMRLVNILTGEYKNFLYNYEIVL